MSDIKLYNRKSKAYIEEAVPSGFFIHFLYNSIYAKSLLLPLIIRKFVSVVAGKYCDMKISKKGIRKFIKYNKIDMNRYAKSSDDFPTFNEFFVRELKTSELDVDRNINFLYAPCDGKIRAYENIEIDSIVQFKNLTYSLAELVGSAELAKKYEGGSVCVIRLSPTDYHRFHHFDEGKALTPTLINGKYYSVNSTKGGAENECENCSCPYGGGCRPRFSAPYPRVRRGLDSFGAHFRQRCFPWR